MKRENGVIKSTKQLGKIIFRIDAISKERPSHKEILTFLKEVITEKFKIKDEIRKKVQTDFIKLDKNLLDVKMKEGFPLVNKKDLKLDFSSASALFKGLCQKIKHNEKVSKDIHQITQSIDKGKLQLKALFERFAAEDYQYLAKESERLKLQEGLLLFLIENSLQPIFEICAEQLKTLVDQEKWWRGYCPICGSKPVMAVLLGEERKKFLVCSCCSYEWRFMRTKCPFCEHEEREGFKYFYNKNEGRAYRIETCQKCKRYIKTIDTQELNEDIFPSVEDIGTLYLDVIAKKEGYTREVLPLGLNL